ncbi:MAG: rhomboid family intramembrane serine protease [Saprospiraceae bacterium]
MLASIWDDVKREFSSGNILTRIILVNIIFFVFINLMKIILAGFYGPGSSQFSDFLHFFCIGKDWWHNLTHPWVLVTTMFLHEGFMHILWNMILFYWLSFIVRDLLGKHHILPIYLLSGLFGSLVYFLSANLTTLPMGQYALGASAAVMGLVLAAGTTAPEYELNLILLGRVKMKYIVVLIIFLDLIGLSGGVNTGGHLAHLGGAFMGWLYIRQLNQGSDLSEPVNKFLHFFANYFSDIKESLSGKSKGPKMVYKNPVTAKAGKGSARTDSGRDRNFQDRVDSILEKIKKSGYESLSEEEKETLFKASKK